MTHSKNIITSKDVAKLAGVSQSTVSRVFVPGSSVAKNTQLKVLEAAKSLNYRPNAFARSLNTNQSNLIGLVFPDTDYPIHMKTLQLISCELQKLGFSTVLMPWQFNESSQHEIPNIFQYKVDGVIVASATLNRSLYNECQSLGIPIVQFARVIPDINHSYVVSDMYSAGQQAATLFHTQGLKSPLYITGNIPTHTNNERQRGFVDMYLKLTGSSPRIFQTDYGYEKACLDFKNLLGKGLSFDCCFCATDYLAMALLDVARHEFKFSIPEDFQVIGFDDIPQANWLSYCLTTFNQDFERLAQETVNTITDKIKNQDSSITKMLIPTQLVRRNTTQ